MLEPMVTLHWQVVRALFGGLFKGIRKVYVGSELCSSSLSLESGELGIAGNVVSLFH